MLEAFLCSSNMYNQPKFELFGLINIYKMVMLDSASVKANAISSYRKEFLAP